MKKTVFKKSAHIIMYGVLGAAILLSGCSMKKSDAANTAKTQENKPAVKVEQPASGSARVTPIVTAAKKVGPAVVGISTKHFTKEVIPNFDDLFDFFANPFKMLKMATLLRTTTLSKTLRKSMFP